MRAPRSVTFTPIGMPSRSPKFEIDLRARVTTGLWPVISASSATTESSSFAFFGASPSPTFTTTFSILGTRSTLSRPNSSMSFGRTRSS